MDMVCTIESLKICSNVNLTLLFSVVFQCLCKISSSNSSSDIISPGWSVHWKREMFMITCRDPIKLMCKIYFLGVFKLANVSAAFFSLYPNFIDVLNFFSRKIRDFDWGERKSGILWASRQGDRKFRSGGSCKNFHLWIKPVIFCVRGCSYPNNWTYIL